MFSNIDWVKTGRQRSAAYPYSPGGEDYTWRSTKGHRSEYAYPGSSCYLYQWQSKIWWTLITVLHIEEVRMQDLNPAQVKAMGYQDKGDFFVDWDQSYPTVPRYFVETNPLIGIVRFRWDSSLRDSMIASYQEYIEDNSRYYRQLNLFG